VLRWGEKRPSTWASYEGRQAAALMPVADAGSSDDGKVVHAIDIWEDGEPRRVEFVGGARPIDDPFGDREELPAPRAESEVEPEGESRVEAVDPPVVDSEPLPLAPTVSEPTPAKPAAKRQEAAAPDSSRKLPCSPELNNDRDCCRDGKHCKQRREQLLKPSIRQVSLDITPRFEIDPEKTPQEVAEERDSRLASSPSRTWRNLAGNTIAQGKLSNYENNHITIAGDDGQSIRVPIGELGEEDLCFVSAWWRLPTECLLVDRPEWNARCWVPSTFTWKASGICHKPLYFEHPALERYGHTTGPLCEPVVSAAHFFVNIALVPYHMGISPPNECEYALGYYRPGSCAPFLIPPFPISLKGALYEAGVVTGMAYFLP
jgi:hypothetical protein